MSATIAFDTHQFVRRLTEHGFTEEQAKTLANEQVALLNSNLATKADLLKWMFGAVIAQGGLIAALVKRL